jgi:sugar phosphate isomerase/epimerase
MYGQKLGIGLSTEFDLTFEEQIRLVSESGFDAFFTPWNYGFETAKYRELADETGMIYQSIHAPHDNTSHIWHGNPEQQGKVVKTLEDCLRDCAENGIEIMVCHVFDGFDREYIPNDTGLENFARVIETAEALGVKIAFENTEGLEYLDAVMSAFSHSGSVGFCLDTGHEMCYNYSENLLKRYGGKLIATHLNDNLGIKDYGGALTWHDDLHLLPYDGIRDWNRTAADLDTCGFQGVMTFEVKRLSKPGRHENDIYCEMSIENYIAEAFKRACRFAARRRLRYKK